MGTPLRALLVEDSELDAELILDALSTSGFDVHHARVASRAALTAALDQPWDVIISDYSMPGFSGSEALDIVLSRGIDTPFLFVSGVIGEVIAVEAMRAGARDYVPKDHLARLGPAARRELREAENRRHRAASEEALRREQGRYRDIFETAGIGIFELDLTELMLQLELRGGAAGGLDVALADPVVARTLLARIRVRDANEEAARIVGAERRDHVAERFPALIAAVPDERVPSVLAQLTRGGHATEYEVELVTIDGQRRHVLFNLRSPGQGEDLLSTVLTALDITVRRQLELQVSAAQRMESLGRLAGGIAHDFNNLLSVISIYTQFVRDELPANSRWRDDLGAVLDASTRAAELANQLLGFSKTEPKRTTWFSPNDAIIATQKLLGRLIGEHVELVTGLHPNLPALHMDRGQFDQIILNLVLNARDAMPDGGRISIETSPVERAAADGRLHRFVGVSVRDTGHGMTEAVRARIFEPFFTTKETGKGTGLGLATVYGIVRGHGGSIDVVSAPGNGATFTVVLPGGEERPIRPTEEAVAGPRLGDGHRVLVVDDDALVRDATRRMLERSGYHAVAVAGLTQALAESGEFDLVVSDQIMPGGTGMMLREAVRQRWPRSRFLLMSGYPGEALAIAEREGDPVDFLDKPFTSEALLAKVAELLARD
ncbi:MAG: response regulator [Kofleriaceae bacterium]|nr:response regulator [Kofleriaceae bacterium]